MRPSRLHPLRQPRHARRHRRARVVASSAVREPVEHTYDPAVLRAREAGGPVDNASYTCACGYTFSASVSTTVTCPHCGAGQPW